MRGEFEGASWWDCARASEVLIKEYGCSVSFILVPPVARVDGAGYSTWVVAATATRRAGRQERGVSAQASFGARGAFKTAPQALHTCLLKIAADLDTARAVAEQSAAF